MGYNADGFVQSVTDENGNTTRYTTDARGNVTARTTTRADVDYTEYFGYYLNTSDPLDPRNDVQVWSADARSANAADTTYRTSRTINDAGRVLVETFPKPAGQSSNPTESHTYTAGGGAIPAGLPATVTARNGGVITNTYTAAGDLATTTDPVGLVTTYTYDALGRASSKGTSAVINGSPVSYGATSFTFNGLSQPLTITSPAVYQPARRGVAHPGRDLHLRRCRPKADGGDLRFHRRGHHPHHQWGYDPAGRVNLITTPDTAVTGQTWDTAGDLVTRQLPSGLVLNHEYDDAHRLIKTTATGAGVDPTNPSATSMIVESRGYDPAGRPASVTNAMGYTTRYTYYTDNLPRTTTAERADPLPDVVTEHRSYDPAGQPTRVTTAGGVATGYTYDPAGDVTTEAFDPAGLNRKTTNTYNIDGSIHHSTATTPAAVPGNLALIKPVTSSAPCSSGQHAGLAVDGSWSDGSGNKWCSAATTKWLQIDLGAVSTISSFVLRHAGAGGQTSSWNTRDFTIQVSNDATTWTTPVTVTANTADTTTHTVATSGRYVKLNITTPTQDGNTSARIYEFDINGTTVGSPASPGRTERVEHTYDLAGRELSTTLDNTGSTPAALTTTRVRDPRGLVTSQTDPAGAVTGFTYDLTGRLLATTGTARTVWVDGTQITGVQPETTLGRNTFGDVTHDRDPNGNATTTTGYDPMGRVTSTTLPTYTPPGGTAITATSTTTYNPQGLPATQTDALGHLTTLSYDKYGRTLTRTEPDPDGAGPKTSPVWSYTYTRNGDRATTTDPSGARQLATYDELGRQDTSTTTERVDATTLNYTTTTGYDLAGNPITTTSPLNHVTTTSYNTAGEKTAVTDPTNRFTKYTLDLAGRTVSTVSGQNTPVGGLRLAGHHDHVRPGRTAHQQQRLHHHRDRHLRHHPAQPHHRLRRGRPHHPDHIRPGPPHLLQLRHRRPTHLRHPAKSFHRRVDSHHRRVGLRP